MAIVAGLHGEMTTACISILLGAVFDFFDGMTARALHISGPIGKELDSLADAVTFGVAPAVLCHHILASYNPSWQYAPLLAFLMAAFSALRLAKFNCDERQTLSFIGLPTPANAILWIGLVYANQIDAIHAFLSYGVYFGLMVCSCYLLICELPMFSLKIKPGHNGFAENSTRYIFLALTLLIIVAAFLLIESQYLMAVAAPIILIYILLSVIDALCKK